MHKGNFEEGVSYGKLHVSYMQIIRWEELDNRMYLYGVLVRVQPFSGRPSSSRPGRRKGSCG